MGLVVILLVIVMSVLGCDGVDVVLMCLCVGACTNQMSLATIIAKNNQTFMFLASVKAIIM